MVALGEAVHGVAQPLDARDALLEFLVREKGFKSIALETGVAEARIVDDYVIRGEGHIDDVVLRGFTWEFGLLPQNRRLVQWLAHYNRGREEAARIGFYGFDLPGSPANLNCARWYDVPLIQVFDFLNRYAPELASQVWPDLRFVICNPELRGAYDSSAQLYVVLRRDPDRTTSAIRLLIALLESNEHRLVQVSSRREFQCAIRAAAGAAQLDANVRLLPRSLLDAGPRDLKAALTSAYDPIGRDVFEQLLAAQNQRDGAMADNVCRLLHHQGRSKIMLFAAASHVSATPCTFTWGGHAGRFKPAGAHLRERLRDRLFIIGSTAGAGSIHFQSHRIELLEPAAGTVDALFGGSRACSHTVDLRRLSAGDLALLDQERPLAHGVGFSLNPVRAFDAVVHFQTLSSAQAAPC